MNSSRNVLCFICLLSFFGCSAGPGGGSSVGSKSTVSAAQVETSKLQEAIKADPAYKIEDSEITLLQKEGIITEADKAQLQAVQ